MVSSVFVGRVAIERFPIWVRLLGAVLLGFELVRVRTALSTQGTASSLFSTLVHGLPFMVMALGLITFRHRVRIDRSRREVLSECGVVVPVVPLRRMSFDDVLDVHLFHEPPPGTPKDGHGYSVQLRWGKGGAEGMTLATMAPLSLARARAKAAAHTIGCPLWAEGLDGFVMPDALDAPLAARRGPRAVIRSKGRVQATMHHNAVKISLAPPGLRRGQWGVFVLASLPVVALGAIGFLFPHPNLPPTRMLLRGVPLGFGMLFWVRVVGNSLVRATRRWLVEASPERLSLRRYTLGLWSRRWEIPGRELEVVVVAEDTAVPRREPCEAVLCVSDRTVVALGHGLSSEELHTLQEAIVAGVQGSKVMETAFLDR